jgi:hypothetical protein
MVLLILLILLLCQILDIILQLIMNMVEIISQFTFCFLSYMRCDIMFSPFKIIM